MTQASDCCDTCAPGSGSCGNRPGLSRIATRRGTHGTYFDAMVARLSAGENKPLDKLQARDRDDPSIALIDAWSMVADVLTFYQERIANEAYLRTATERRSLNEIARLVGYRPRPGVAATAHLAFSLENESEPAAIPKGTRINSIPGPGEEMVAFETSEAILARREWNSIPPRLTGPQTWEGARKMGGLYVKGIKTRLKPTSAILVGFGGGPVELKLVRNIVEDSDKDRTLILFDVPEPAPPPPPPPPPPPAVLPPPPESDEGRPSRVFGMEMVNLSLPMAVPPPNSAALDRSIEASFATGADTLPRLLGAIRPALGKTLYRALRNLPAPAPEPIELYAMRVDARPFGHNAPLKLKGMGHQPEFEEWNGALDSGSRQRHDQTDLYLDAEYEILPDSMVAIARADGDPIILGTAKRREEERLSITPASINAYGLSGKSVRIRWNREVARPWLLPEELEGDNADFTPVRTTRVFAGSERLELADAPILNDVGGDAIELDGVYDGLEPGRWLIVEGERTDIRDAGGRAIGGIRAAELVMLKAVEQSASTMAPSDRADKLRTILTLAANAAGNPGLAYSYKRDTVRIYANVAAASHGEARTEVLGNGDATLSLQTFSLKQPPLTHVTSATATGTKSTLEVRVNDLLWREVPSLAGVGPNDRCYVTRDDDEGVTSIIFGNGVRGARPPSGRENVKAAYRSGIGKPGNVRAGSLSLLATRPSGVKEVINPLPATGGADREDLQSIRRNAPIALMALDRLISTPDYASFARAFGGIGKANSVRMAGLDVGVVVAGVDDAPIAPGSELLRNLASAMGRFGDPQVMVRVEPRERLVLVIQANVRIEPDRLWTIIEPKIRTALLNEFGFARIEIGESLPLARALKAIQAVDGVSYADIDVFDSLDEEEILAGIVAGPGGDLGLHPLLKVKPNQIAYFAADVPDTLILRELTS